MLARALLRDRSSERRLGSLAGALAGVALAAALMTRAGSASAEPLRLHGEGTLARAVTGHQRSEFGFGARGLAALELPLWPTLGVEAELGALWLSERAAPADPTLAPHGSATALTGALGLRVRPFAGAASEPSAVGGLWLAGAAGVAETGGLTRALVEARAGYDLALAGGRLGLGPMVGLSHVFQPDSALRPDDANLLLFGVHAVLGAGAKRAVDGDRDRDGIRDSLDRCPDDPEDRDGFEDEDGCPDPDNDRDGIPDAKDRCPNEPEDRDGF
ncbi:MAG: hypothetical protein OZ921_16545, partial [Sorangiineae bacterium]|nr:hypothetical protein [Sorangiineae bacterium]